MYRVRNEPFDYEAFGDYLTAVRNEAGFANDAALARAAGVRASIISRWRRGEMRPGHENLNRIAAAVRIPAVNLWIVAGLADPEDLDMSEAPDISVLPREFIDLIELWRDDRLKEADREFVRRQISILVAGMRGELGESGRGRPNSQRKVS